MYRWWWPSVWTHICVIDWLTHSVNSLAPGGFENIFQNVFFKLISWIDTLSNSCETALRSMPQNPSDDKSTLVQVMAWCRQAASHYLSQCCPKSLSPYGVTRPQWVNALKVFYEHIETKWPHFVNDIFKFIFLYKNRCVLIKISLKSLPKGINNKPALVQIMAWHRTQDKSLSEPVIT